MGEENREEEKGEKKSKGNGKGREKEVRFILFIATLIVQQLDFVLTVNIN